MTMFPGGSLQPPTVRLLALLVIVALSAAIIPVLSNVPHSGSEEFHYTLEMFGGVIGLLAGLTIISNFYALGNRFHLLIGIAFLVNGAGDFAHGILSFHSGGAHPSMPPIQQERAIPGTEVMGRILMGLILIAAAAIPPAKTHSGSKEAETMWAIIAAVPLMMTATIGAFYLPLPEFVYPGAVISRPADFLAALLFLAALCLFIKRYRHKPDILTWWVTLSIALSVSGQLTISFSRPLHDFYFVVGHIYKVIGYTAPLLGVSIYLAHTIIQRDEARKKLAESHAALEASVAARTAELAESEERYRTLVERASDGIIMIIDGKMEYVNPSAARMVGYGIGEITGNPFAEFIHPDARPRVEDIYRRRMAGEPVPPVYETSLLNSAGEKTSVEVSTSVISYAGKKTDYVIVRDITERLRAEKILRESERRLKETMDKISLLAVQIDMEGNIEFINDYLLDLTGWKREEVLGKNWFHTFLPAEIGDEVYEVFLHIVKTGGDLGSHYENEIITRNGERRLISWSNIALRSMSEAIIGASSIGEDITERKRMEVALKEREEEFRAISESAVDAIIEIDSAGKVIYWNPAAEEIFGYSREEMAGDNFHYRCVPAKYKDIFEKGFAGFRRTGTGTAIGKTLELSALRKGGEEFPVELSLSAIRRGTEWQAVGIVRDITERKKAEEALKKTNVALQEAVNQLEATQRMLVRQEKLASLGELAAGVAHEIKNPLNIISSSVQLLMMEEGLPPDVRETYDSIMQQIARTVKIINNLRDFARERKPEKKRVDLHELLEKTISLVEYEMRVENITIERKYDRGAIEVMVDYDQMAQVLLNLIGNARDSLNKKRSSFSYDQLETSGWQGRITIESSVKDSLVHLSFTDNGMGIPSAVIGRVFDPFFTMKPEGEGTGLGLSIAMGIVENHGGTLDVQSVDGEWTAFEIVLPDQTWGSEEV